jgi:copper chaperone CopZ
MDGVIDAEASFISGKATIKFDDSKITLEQIIDNFKRASMPVIGKPKWIK